MLIKVPVCKEHKTQDCMKPYWQGDGFNIPLDKVYLCSKVVEKLYYKKKRGGLK